MSEYKIIIMGKIDALISQKEREGGERKARKREGGRAKRLI